MNTNVSSAAKTAKNANNLCTSLARRAVDVPSCEIFQRDALHSQRTLVSVYNTARRDYTACAAKYKLSIKRAAASIRSAYARCNNLFGEICLPILNSPEMACEACSSSCEALCTSCARVGDCSSIYAPICTLCPGANPYCCA